jgi:5'-nucleotidase/UDP-sugar diphosphatase
MKILLLASAAAVTLSAGMTVADYKLTILHTNDFHACLELVSKYDSGCGAEDNAEGKCFGGSAHLVTAIDEACARSDNSILVDGGDQFQGTLFYTYYKRETSCRDDEQDGLYGYDRWQP